MLAGPFEEAANHDGAAEISLFDALPGQEDIAYYERNLGAVGYVKIVNATDEIVLPNQMEARVYLSMFIKQHELLLQLNVAETSKLLALNCGEGMTGITALLHGWRSVTFADTRAQTLLQSTWPNVFLNCPENMAMVKCLQFASWPALSSALVIQNPTEVSGISELSDIHFEVVLLAMATTIDNPQWDELQELLVRHLSGSGVALVCLPERSFAPLLRFVHRLLEYTVLHSPVPTGGGYEIVQFKRRQQM